MSSHTTIQNSGPIKNQSYRMYFYMVSTGSTPTPGNSVTGMTSWTIKKTSRDGAAFVNLTNNPVEIGNGWYYIVLNAAEMNADAILIQIRGTSPSYTSRLYNTLIKTSSVITTGISLSDPVTNIGDFPYGTPTIGDVLSFLYQYFKKRRKQGTWNLTKHINNG